MQYPQSTLPHYASVRGLPYSARNPNQRSTQPRWQPFPLGMALGELAPLVPHRSTGALDNDNISELDATAMAFFAGIILIRGALGYQAGKAMAPPGSAEKTWGWVGVPIGLITGTLGLGLMGMVSLANRR